ncbi:hypothetical protein ACJX0J_014951, partial [Zea mays]
KTEIAYCCIVIECVAITNVESCYLCLEAEVATNKLLSAVFMLAVVPSVLCQLLPVSVVSQDFSTCFEQVFDCNVLVFFLDFGLFIPESLKNILTIFNEKAARS